ncbi:MAG: PBP1A family penicillin-binding protein [Clostridia bacterium]|nr:PBP1A family penicillin-binding protein [Clostridia bacterium]
MNSKQKKASSAAQRHKRPVSPVVRFVLTVTKILIVFFVAISCAVLGIVGGALYGYIKTAPLITEDQIKLKKFTSFVYDDSKETVIAELKGEENRVWVDDKDIPKYLKDAFVAIEDERFYDHPGIDLKRIASSIISLGKSGGASTITQQVVRNLTGETQRTLQRKIQEQWRAIQLEKKLDKWQILELYMNLIYMGGQNIHGVQSAARAYFNKDVWDLSLAECASLAGITNWPAKYTPTTTEGIKHNLERQRVILDKMLELKKITQEEYDKAINEKLNFVQGNAAQPKSTSKQSYFVDKVISDVKRDLMAQGMSEQIALKTIYNNGLKIYTTMDSALQKEMDAVYKDEKFFPIVNKKAGQPQSGMVIIDPKTGQVKALYGGFGEKQGNTLNRATQIQRQPGSSLKPLVVYGPALNEKIITAATVYDDVPVYLNPQEKNKRYPLNYDLSYRGLTNIRDSIRDSINVVAAKVWMDLEQYQPGISLQYLKKSGISREKERYISIAMGGLYTGVSPLEMAAAYVPFVNKGVYIQPTTYTKVLDMDGKVILEKKPKNEIVYEETTAFIMTNMMRDVCRLGTAYPYGLLQKGSMPSAGKTGTTSDNKDKWFVGYSPYYVAATWYGYDTPTQLINTEYSQALKIWHEVMERVHKNLKPVEFPEPPGLVRKTICIYSGKVISDLCSKDPRNNAVRPGEYFIKGTEPRDDDPCDVHVALNVCKDSKDVYNRNLLFGPNCPVDSMLEAVFIRRKTPFIPSSADDPYPRDMKYEAPLGEYCNVHSLGINSPATDTDPKAVTHEGINVNEDH